VKKFKFRLQNVLDARVKAYEDVRLALARVQTILKTQIQKLEELYKAHNKTKINLEQLIIGGTQIDLTFINSHQNYIEKLSVDIKNQHKLIADTEVMVEAKTKETVEALKEKTMMEKLKEKDFKDFMSNFEKLQMAEIDDISNNRYSRAK